MKGSGIVACFPSASGQGTRRRADQNADDAMDVLCQQTGGLGNGILWDKAPSA